MLTDGDLEKPTTVEAPQQVGDKSWIQWEFPGSVTVRSITIGMQELGMFAAMSGLGAPESCGCANRFFFDIEAQYGFGAIRLARITEPWSA